MKLVQAIALQLQISRRKASQLIDEGSVRVNGIVCLEYSFPIDPKKERIEIVTEVESNRKPPQDNKRLKNKDKNDFMKKGLPSIIASSPKVIKEPSQLEDFPKLPELLKNDLLNQEKICLAFYKPRGIVTSLDGKANSLNKIIEEINIPNLKPVGRLDAESEGLLLLTNDGNLINYFIHPKNKVSKSYRIWASGYKDLRQLEHLKTLLNVKNFEELKSKIIIEAELQEGQNRQIRRACAQSGLFVERILRIGIGAVKLGKLNPGEWKELNSSEIQGL